MAASETQFDLLRHGETTGALCLRGRTDDPLSERGWSQLQAAVAGDRRWDAIVASGLARSQGFARWLADERGCELVVDDRLNEFDFGDWDGRTLDALWRDCGDEIAAFFGDPDAVTPPGGETAAAFRARVRAARDALVGRYPGSRLLVVGHGGVLRQWVADVVGARGNTHAVLEWPHAAMSRLRAYQAPGDDPAWSLVFHGFQSSEFCPSECVETGDDLGQARG